MVYNSFNFIIIFPFIFFFYYAIPNRCQRARNLFLLAVSYLLYLNWVPVYALILLGVTAVTYLSARLLERSDKRRRIVLVGGGSFSLAAPVL